jgi:hypothetical protein
VTTPSRRSEIRRRRTRKEKIKKLRKRYSNAASEAERNSIFDKVRRVWPGVSREELSKTG